MPGIVRKGNQTPTRVAVGFGRAQSRNLLSVRGALVLLILLLFAIGLTVVYRRTSEAQRMAQPATNSYTRPHQPAAPINKDEATVMESTESSDQNMRPSISADVQVNGQSVNVPENGGTVHREIISSDGTKTSVDVKLDSSTSASSVQGQSTFNLNVQSNQESESEAE